MKVLVVEDDAGVGRIISNGLKANGVDVDWLRGGEQLFRQLSIADYDAIVLDLMLPDSDGLSLCRKLRHNGLTTPILILTARDTLEDKLEGFNAGADDYLGKPFAVDELLARLKAIVRRVAPVNSNARIKIGSLAIDLLSRDATVAGAHVDLTRREFDVLVVLAQNAGQVVTRERLLQTAWGADADVTPNTVDVYVGYLRRKMRAAGSAPAIVTMRGIGFKLG